MSARRGRIILASASPRRRALLAGARFEVEVRPSGADETWPEGASTTEGAMSLAQRKANAITMPAETVVAADTLVVLGETRLEKPRDATDAMRMLRRLSGVRHEVVTGYVVRRDQREQRGAVTTEVTFRPLSDAEIEHYIETGEPFDKAGAYGIQGEGGGLVDRVEGSYTNIVGLPLREVIAAIEAVA